MDSHGLASARRLAGSQQVSGGLCLAREELNLEIDLQFGLAFGSRFAQASSFAISDFNSKS